MTHVVQIAFDFDDAKVTKTLEDTVVLKVTKDIEQEIVDKIFDKQWRGWGENRAHADPSKDPLQNWAQEFVGKIIDENKDYICRLAANQIADRAMRSQKMREAIVGKIGE